MSSRGKYTTVSIPVELADKVKAQIAGTGFKNLSDYTTFLLREIASSNDGGKKEAEYKRRIRGKLSSLGYI